MPKLGELAQDYIDHSQAICDEEMEIRLKAMRERDRLQDNGYGDELMEMQQILWPKDRVLNNDFAIDMLFGVTEQGEDLLVWCQGKVIKCVREYSCGKKLKVRIEWDDKCPGAKQTQELLKMSDWNPQRQTEGAWREDLHHKILNIE